MLRIIVHNTKLPFPTVDSIVDLWVYSLFTHLALDLESLADIATTLLSVQELEELAPEITRKDYIAVGVYSEWSAFTYTSTAIATA